MLGALIPCGGGPPIALLLPKVLVGRHSRCDIPLAFLTVSARHCELELIDGVWFVRDLGSRNGIQVNGVACVSERLMPHDILSVAAYRYTITYTPPEGESASPRETTDRFGGSLLEKAGLVPRAAAAPARNPQGSGPPAAAPSDSPLGELVPCGGGNPVPLLQPKLIVGRDARCDIALRFPSVSSRHCELEFKHGYWFVRDLGSSNGIRVDGVACESKCLLPQCVLSISQYRYKIRYTPQGDGPPTVGKEEQTVDRSFRQVLGLGSRDSSATIKTSAPPEWTDPLARLPREEEADQPRKRWSIDEPD